MARRRRSFLFDNITRKLVTNTFKTVQQVFKDEQNQVIANTDVLTSAQVETKVASLSIANLHEDTTPQLNGTARCSTTKYFSRLSDLAY